MRSIQEYLPKFSERNVRLVAISVDPVEVTAHHCEKQGYTFIFLSDPKAEVIRRYDLLHPGGHGAEDIARPAEVLVDPAGVVRWVNLTESFRVRPKGEEVLKVLDDLEVKPASKSTTP
ncbi:MAG: redoxin domain-containing protein [Acidobacteria bacterium]|nr:redoxin domain-containing protein [Acidobacteriota bacterium]